MSLEESELDEWARNGAHEEELPVTEDIEHKHWDHYACAEDKMIPLYPFTKRAVISLYDAMPDQKTPRYILRDIVEPAVREAVTDVSSFPRFCTGSEWRLPIPEAVENRIGSLTSSFDMPVEEKALYRNRLTAFIRFWTNTTLDVTDDGYISGVRKELFRDLHFDAFIEKLTKTTVVKAATEIDDDVIEDEPV